MGRGRAGVPGGRRLQPRLDAGGWAAVPAPPGAGVVAGYPAVAALAAWSALALWAGPAWMAAWLILTFAALHALTPEPGGGGRRNPLAGSRVSIEM